MHAPLAVAIVLLLALQAVFAVEPSGNDEAAALRAAATFYASFDDKVQGDFGVGGVTLSTRTNHPTEKGQFVVEKGFNAKAIRIGKGIHGGALDAVDVLPNNGRIFFPLKGNIAFQQGGWGGAVSMWINTDPNQLLKTRFCDPVQITQKGANNGGIWFDFNDAKPRDLRMGMFPAIPEGKPGIKEEDANAPMVRVKGVTFKAGEWHHIVLSWRNFDTGKPDAEATLYIDGRRIGDVKERDIAMAWDVDKAGIYVAVNYIGLLDEFAVFGRALTPAEVAALHKNPGVLTGLKGK
jgi:hypothetical protein